jgi:uncharacterized protein YbjT (DUF2867 family)
MLNKRQAPSVASNEMSYRTKVLVLGGTGHLGVQVLSEVVQRGHQVRALVRSDSETGKLRALGVELVQGNLLDRASLDAALVGCDTLITTAIGYSNRRKGDGRSGTDTTGNRNLVDAAAAARIRRFVFCSVLTCDGARSVPHFWHKKLVEDYLVERDVPFVALRPGAFLDQGPADFWAAGLRKGRLRFAANPEVPLTFVHSSDVAKYLAGALELELGNTSVRIDIGTDRAVSLAELAAIMATFLGRPITPQVPPWPIISLALLAAGLFDPWQRDLRSMMAYIQRGGYVADVTEQRKHFGEVPTIEASVKRYLDGIGHLSLPAKDKERAA